MKITITVEELIDKGMWEEVCDTFGINEWAVNEGLMDSDSTLTFNEEQARKLGLI